MWLLSYFSEEENGLGCVSPGQGSVGGQDVQVGCHTLNLALLTPCLLSPSCQASPESKHRGRLSQRAGAGRSQGQSSSHGETLHTPARPANAWPDGRGTGQAPPPNMGFYKVFNRLEINILRHAEHQYISEI